MEQITAQQDMPAWLVAELRSDQAGETGAVEIYRGILALSKDPDLRAFATHHMETEQKHLDLINTILPHAERTRLLPVWKVMGFLTGALPAIFGAKAVYATIEAVETFVDHHYQQQIDQLDTQSLLPEIKAALVACQADEVAHRDEAAGLVDGPLNPLHKAWAFVVGFGSQAAVVVAKRI
ncbi:MAG: demethoxyubiquinone hydroxylase family protein [Pseudomonadota bacterium]